MKKLITVLSVILTVSVLSTSLFADNDGVPASTKKNSKITGYVFDKATGETLSGVKIKTDGETVTYTDIDGYFEVEISGTSQNITADFVSYKQVTVNSKNDFLKIELISKDVIE